MSRKIDKIRMRVFKIWFLTLGVIVLAFGEKLLGVRDLAPPFASTFQSLQMMVGLVLPQIGIMSAFYFNLNRQRDKLESLTQEQVTVITLFSVSYHVIFIAAVIFGIVFYKFDQQADGESLERNSAAVVAIMGLFSIFLAPIAFLFSKPNDAASHKATMSGGMEE